MHTYTHTETYVHNAHTCMHAYMHTYCIGVGIFRVPREHMEPPWPYPL